MSNIALVLVSLTSAIPGGVLTAMLVMNFLERADRLTGMLWIVSIATLLTSVLITLLPVGVLLFGPKTEKAGQEKKPEVDEGGLEEAEFAEDEADLLEVDEEADLEDEEDLVAGEGDELSMDDEEAGEESAEKPEQGATVAFEADEGEDLFMEDEGEFDLELDEEDDEEDEK